MIEKNYKSLINEERKFRDDKSSSKKTKTPYKREKSTKHHWLEEADLDPLFDETEYVDTR